MKKIIRDFLNEMEFYRKSSKNTLDSYKRTLSDFLSNRNYKITDRAVKNYIMELNKRNYQSSTVNQKISAIKSFYNYLVENNILNYNPTKAIRFVKEDEKEFKYLNKKELNDLMDEIKDVKLIDRTIIKLMLATAMRVNVIPRLKKDNFNFDKNLITFYNKKSKKTQTINLRDDVIDTVREYFNTHNSEYAFISNRGNVISKRTVQRHVKKHIKKVVDDESKAHAHIIRKSVLMKLANSDVPIHVLKDFAGHSSVKSTEKYISSTQENIKSASELLVF